MAEGQITSPILGNFSELGKMFMDGTARINAIKQEVAKERLALNASLTESIDEIGATGIAEWDKVVHSGAQQFRSVVAQAIRDNKAGRISRSDVSALVSNFQTQAGMLANTTKIYTEKSDAIQKRIDAGNESPKALADYNTAWFQDNSMTDYNIEGDDGKMRANQKIVQSKIINNQLHFVSTKEIKVPKMIEGVEQKVGGETVYETKTITQTMPAGSFLDTNIKGAPAFDVDKKTKDLASTLGNKVTFLDPVTNMPLSNPMTTKTVGVSGDLITNSIIAPESFPTIVNLVENRLREINPATAATILYDQFGARSLFHDDSPGVRPEDEWRKEFGITKARGDLYLDTEVPAFTDVDGNAINLTADPLVLGMSDDGVSIASPEQVEMAKAFMREKYYGAMNITQKQIIDRKKRAASGKTDPTLSQIVLSEYQSNGVMKPIDNEFIRQTVGLGSLLVANLTQEYETAKGSMSATGSYEPPQIASVGGTTTNYNYTPASVMALLKPDSNRTITGASFTGQAIKLLDKEIKVSTVHGTPLDTINQIAISQDEDGSANTVVMLIGDSVFRESDTSLKIEQGGGSDRSVDTQTSIQRTEAGVAVLTNNQLPSVYEELYKISEFREIMEKRGFVGISAKYKENVGTEANPVYKEKSGQFIDAFESYANYLKELD